MNKKTNKDWYNQIEPEIREIVRLLRNNGFNTTNSCGHEMTVELILGNLDEAEHLAIFLVENGHKDFRINAELYVPNDGYWDRRATIILK